VFPPGLPAFAFVDLETTGTFAGGDRITEIGIVRVQRDGDAAPRVTEWASLVDPGVPIPPAIQVLTGITDAMVACAPSFDQVARDVAELLAGCVFVAHNARFDYGFLKHAFARIGHSFSARASPSARWRSPTASPWRAISASSPWPPCASGNRRRDSRTVHSDGARQFVSSRANSRRMKP